MVDKNSQPQAKVQPAKEVSAAKPVKGTESKEENKKVQPAKEVKEAKVAKYPFPITGIETVVINGKNYIHVNVQEGNGVTYELSNLPPKYRDLVEPFVSKLKE